MEFYDKLVEKFHDLLKVQNLAVSKAKVKLYLLRAFYRKCFEEYDAVTLIILYLKVLHDMVPKNSSIYS